MSGRSPRWIAVKKAPMGFIVTITGTFDATNGYVTIAGTKYTAAAEVQVNAGDEISVYVGATITSVGNNSSYIEKDGARVHSGIGSYSFTVDTNATITLARNQYRHYFYWTASITTS